MDLEAAEKELTVRLYQWGQKDFAREQREGCPLLTPMRDASLQKCLVYVRSLSPEDRIQFVLARQKLMHPLAVALLGETISADDKVWNDNFRMAMSQIHLEEFSWAEATKVFSVKRSLVQRILLPILTSAYGVKPQKFDSLQWNYQEQFGNWCFSTELDLGGTWGTEIRYWFRLKHDGDQPRGLLPVQYKVGGISVAYFQVFDLQSLYGLGSQPRYAIANEEQVSLAAQSLIDVHAHIIRSVPEWLDGLSVGTQIP